jgi:hypothetical protein
MVSPLPNRMIPAEEIYFNFEDHTRFCKESLIVETEGRALVPMILSPGQVRLHQAIECQRQAGKPVRIIYLKSRRIQATTGTAAEFYRATAFSAGVHTVVLAHDAPSSEKIFSIYRRFHQKYRPFAGAIGLPPSRVLSDRIHFAYDGAPEFTFIQVHTAGNENFGRSFRITQSALLGVPLLPGLGRHARLGHERGAQNPGHYRLADDLNQCRRDAGIPFRTIIVTLSRPRYSCCLVSTPVRT